MQKHLPVGVQIRDQQELKVNCLECREHQLPHRHQVVEEAHDRQFRKHRRHWLQLHHQHQLQMLEMQEDNRHHSPMSTQDSQQDRLLQWTGQMEHKVDNRDLQEDRAQHRVQFSPHCFTHAHSDVQLQQIIR